MKKFIYKFTNKINGKIYIGQTNNIVRRYNEHKHQYQSNDNKIFYQAIQKYGFENFSFEILEETENYNEREKYWIKFYHSYIEDELCNGYNMTIGGDEPPVKKGENHHYASHTKEEFEITFNLIKNTKLPFKQIAKQCNYDVTSIEKINKGELWKKDNENYPLRKEQTLQFLQERADNIINDLINTNLTQKEIGEKYLVGRSTITAINRGQNFKRDNIDYPIRKNNQQSKVILMLDENNNIINEFNNSIEAAKFLGENFKASNIRCCAQGKTKSAYGYFWKYKDK